MTVAELLAFAGTIGGGSAPILFVMWWLERQDRRRLERILLNYLPAMEGNARVIRSVGKVLGAIDDGD